MPRKPEGLNFVGVGEVLPFVRVTGGGLDQPDAVGARLLMEAGPDAIIRYGATLEPP